MKTCSQFACTAYEKEGRVNLSVEDCRFIVSLYEGSLVASPDGCVHDPPSDLPNDLLEIKCPYTKRTQTPQKACENAEFYYAKQKMAS